MGRGGAYITRGRSEIRFSHVHSGPYTALVVPFFTQPVSAYFELPEGGDGKQGRVWAEREEGAGVDAPTSIAVSILALLCLSTIQPVSAYFELPAEGVGTSMVGTGCVGGNSANVGSGNRCCRIRFTQTRPSSCRAYRRFVRENRLFEPSVYAFCKCSMPLIALLVWGYVASVTDLGKGGAGSYLYGDRHDLNLSL